MATKWKCGVCRKTGHDRRNCKIVANYLNECEEDKDDIAKEYSLHLNADCIICLEKGNVHNRLPCGHFVHDMCIWKWIQSKSDISYAKPDCPVCRKELIFQKEEIETNLCHGFNSKNELVNLTLDKYYGRLQVNAVISPSCNTYEMDLKGYENESILIKQLVKRIRAKEKCQKKIIE